MLDPSSQSLAVSTSTPTDSITNETGTHSVLAKSTPNLVDGEYIGSTFNTRERIYCYVVKTLRMLYAFDAALSQPLLHCAMSGHAESEEIAM